MLKTPGEILDHVRAEFGLREEQYSMLYRLFKASLEEMYEAFDAALKLADVPDHEQDEEWERQRTALYNLWKERL
jgi:hypothetical protein